MKQFVESLKRLWISKAIDDKKINELFISGKITEIEKDYILNKKA